jgi:beta-1,4-mannosyl-glycoprotein beta-1,4-N-acetylglucosaminyltransferase
MLKAKLEYLYNTVDFFVIVESTLTHSGNKKTLDLINNFSEFEKYKQKIVHVVVNDDIESLGLSKPKLSFIKRFNHKIENNSDNSIKRGDFQRNKAAIEGLTKLSLNDDDIIVISDCDEIANRETLQNLKINGIDNIYSLDQELYYYNINCKHTSSKWHLSKCLPYKFVKQYNNCLSEIRNIVSLPIIENGGWHLSYFGNIDFMIDKIVQSADQSMNKDQYKNREVIKQRISENKDLFGRPDIVFEYIENPCISTELVKILESYGF